MKQDERQPVKKQPMFGVGVVYPRAWDDRGRSALTREQIEKQAELARRWFEAAMRGRLAEL